MPAPQRGRRASVPDDGRLSPRRRRVNRTVECEAAPGSQRRARVRGELSRWRNTLRHAPRPWFLSRSIVCRKWPCSAGYLRYPHLGRGVIKAIRRGPKRRPPPADNPRLDPAPCRPYGQQSLRELTLEANDRSRWTPKSPLHAQISFVVFLHMCSRRRGCNSRAFLDSLRGGKTLARSTRPA